MIRTILFYTFLISSTTLSGASCTNSASSISENTLHLLVDGKWRALKPLPAVNSFARKEIGRFAIKFADDIDADEQRAFSVLIKNQNFGSNGEGVPRRVFLSSRNSTGAFGTTTFQGRSLLEAYILAHLGRISVPGTKISKIHHFYKKNKNKTSTYKGIRKIAFLFDDVEIEYIKEQNPTLASILMDIKAGVEVATLLKRISLVSPANAKDIKLSNKSAKKIIYLNTFTKKGLVSERGDGMPTCFKLRHAKKKELNLLQESTYKMHDFDGEVVNFDDVDEFGKTLKWKIVWN